jgi:predicted transcriptional regulator
MQDYIARARRLVETEEALPLEYKRIGAGLRTLREQRGVSLRSLARRLRVSAAFLSDMELGKRRYALKHIVQTVELLTPQ